MNTRKWILFFPRAMVEGMLAPIVVEQPKAVLWFSRLGLGLYTWGCIASKPIPYLVPYGIYQLVVWSANEPIVRWTILSMGVSARRVLKRSDLLQCEAEPPRLAEFFVGLFAVKRYRASLLLCLSEDFQNDLAAGMSLSRAKRRYWAAALNSIGPQLWAAVGRIGVIGIVADYVRGKLGGA